MALAAIEEMEVFAQRWWPWAERLAVGDQQLSVLGDGAEWIWDHAEWQFPNRQEVLDIFHSSEHLSALAKAGCGEGTTEATRWLKESRLALLERGYEGLCAYVASSATWVANRAGLEGAAAEELNYFCGHRSRLAYAERLRQGQPALFFDRSKSQSAIAAAPRQDDAHRVLALVVGKRAQKAIDRPAKLTVRRRLRDAKFSVPDSQRCIRRDDPDRVWCRECAILCLSDLHLRMPTQQFDKHAFVMRIEMLDEHEGQAAVRRHIREECLKGFKTSSGGANPDDESACWRVGNGSRWRSFHRARGFCSRRVVLPLTFSRANHALAIPQPPSMRRTYMLRARIIS